MERKVGEIFTYKGKTYQVAKNTALCEGCAFLKNSACCWLQTILGSCGSAQRKDREEVIFKEIKNMEIKNNQLTIDIPEGMEIDVENSDLTKGIVKFKKKSITYEDVFKALNIKTISGITVHKEHKDKLQALAQLMLIAKYYNKDWTPNWSNSYEHKFYICYDYSARKYTIGQSWTESCFYVYFRFRNEAEEVINNPNFKDILDIIFRT